MLRAEQDEREVVEKRKMSKIRRKKLRFVTAAFLAGQQKRQREQKFEESGGKQRPPNSVQTDFLLIIAAFSRAEREQGGQK